jgi:hypothetical protein
MRTTRSVFLAGCGLALLVPSCDIGGTANRVFQPLAFPFANPGDIIGIAAFGIPNWSGTEPHSGIDMQVNHSLASTRIISPTAGRVRSISAHENSFSDPVGQLIVTVEITINSEWTLYVVLEPSSADPAMRTAQLATILVREGQDVEVGTPVADLLVGTLGYPHLHYWIDQNREAVCPYVVSSEAARAVFDSLARLPDSHLPDGNICYGQP